jgi:HAMP domain-containing protein
MRALLILLGVLWLGWFLRRAWSQLTGARRSRGPAAHRPADGVYTDLTDQEISDADYEEIP